MLTVDVAASQLCLSQVSSLESEFEKAANSACVHVPSLPRLSATTFEFERFANADEKVDQATRARMLKPYIIAATHY